MIKCNFSKKYGCSKAYITTYNYTYGRNGQIACLDKIFNNYHRFVTQVHETWVLHVTRGPKNWVP